MRKFRLFDQKSGFVVILYVYIQILRSIGSHGGQHVKKLIVLNGIVFIVEQCGVEQLRSIAYITGHCFCSYAVALLIRLVTFLRFVCLYDLIRVSMLMCCFLIFVVLLLIVLFTFCF